VATIADRGWNRQDVPLTHARLPHVTFSEVIMVTEESKRWDVTLRHLGQSQHGSRFQSGSSSKELGAG
jgi:hypothetical protein